MPSKKSKVLTNNALISDEQILKSNLVNNSLYFIFTKFVYKKHDYYVHENGSVIDNKGEFIGIFDKNVILFFDDKKNK